ERLCRTLYYQGKGWEEIASEMRKRGIEPSMIWFQLNRMGAWHEHLKALRNQGVTDSECIHSLRSIQAAWPDISWAYLKIGYRPAEIISILIHPYRAMDDGRSSLSALVAGAIPVEGDGDLLPVKGLLEGLGEDPYEIVQCMPFIEERKEAILRRMGLSPKEQQPH
ncbi:MAG: hypothetical protein JST16_10075, partial [Bdellovibrionales bacterium]|nr:hypothetical protein [Bdellovibrionales bacterium]